MGIIDSFNDEQFSKIMQTSSSWKQIGEKLGYKNNISSNNKKKIINRCNSLGINSPAIKKIDPVEQKTKGTLFNTRKNWQSARTSIRKIAQKNYDNAGLPYVCAICGYSNHIEIAHIKAVSEFDDNTLISEIDNSSNLIGLCPNHHWEFDNGLLTKEYILGIRNNLG